MVYTVVVVSPLELRQKSLLDVPDRIGALMKIAGATGAICPVTLACQSIELLHSVSILGIHTALWV